MANQRIRDPLHDLIEFSDNDKQLERTLWKVIQTRPFQRLRRVKQLGFSDLVYPGASHSRFAHSIGVFHTARQLMEVVRRFALKDDPDKERKALAAALVHDLGHGPFSHAFEEVGKRLELKLANHEVVSDILIRNSEIAEVFSEEIDKYFAEAVADIIKDDGIKTVHHAVVSSQFDADRLDYMRRDRMMTGTQHSAIDFRWLLANLEIGAVENGVDDTPLGRIETFVLGPKAIHAAEAFILGLFQLYPTVYFHKATRGAEKIFTELLVRAVTLVRDGKSDVLGLSKNHPIVRFSQNPEDIEAALALDDTVIWGALSQMSEAEDILIAEFAKRLRDRNLYKCYDIRTQVSHSIDPSGINNDENIDKIDRCCARIKKNLTDWTLNKKGDCPRILLDEGERSPYKSGTKSKGPLDRINIRTVNNTFIDLKDRSSVVSALKTYKLFRAYFEGSDEEARKTIKQTIEEEIKR